MRWLVITLAIIGLLAVSQRTFRTILEQSGRTTPDPQAFDAGLTQRPVLTLVHILPGALFMILGPLQFSTRLRARRPRLHRRIGWAFTATSLVIGISAMALTLQTAIGGVNERVAIVLFDTVFLVALIKGFRLARARRFREHREWMLRAFSIGLAVATIRPIIGIFFGLYKAKNFLPPQEFFGIAFWLGFTLHLIGTEIWINRSRTAPLATAVR